MKIFINKLIIMILVGATLFSCSKEDKLPEKSTITEEPIESENPTQSESTISGAVVLLTGSTLNVNDLTITSPMGSASVSNGSYEIETLEDKFLTQLVTDADGKIVLMGFNYPGQSDFEINAASTALALLMNLPSSLRMAPEAKQELITRILNDSSFKDVVSTIEKGLLNGTNTLDVSNIQLAESMNLFYQQLLFPETNKAKKLEYSYEPVEVRLVNNEITFVNLGKTYESVVGIYKDDALVHTINVERITFIPTTLGDALGAFASAYGGTELPGNLQAQEYAYTFDSDGQYDIKIRTSKLADDAIENNVALLNNIINWSVDIVVEVLPLGDCVQPLIANLKQHVQTFGSFSNANTKQQKIGLLYDVLYSFFGETTALITCFTSVEELDDFLGKFSNVIQFLDLVGRIGNGGNILVGITQLVADEGKMDLCYTVEGEQVTECNEPDVYVAGTITNEGHLVATLWKNGVATSLTAGRGSASSVYVSGTDVYVAGTEFNANRIGIAKVWKNGIATSLTDGSYASEATSVYVSGTDVYVAGIALEYNAENNPIRVAKMWKNGVVSSLTTTQSKGVTTSCIFVKEP